MLCARTQFADSVWMFFSWRRRLAQVALLACFAAIAGIAGRAGREDDILKLVPEQALGFVVINQPSAADAKLQQLGQQMNLPIPSLLAKLQGSDGIRKGLDKKRPIALLVLPPKDGTSLSSVIALLPVTDYAKFLEQFKPEDAEGGVSKIQIWGSPSLVRNIGSYAAISTPNIPRGPGERREAGRRGTCRTGPLAEVVGEERRGRGRACAGNPLALGQGATRGRRH